MFLHFNNIQFDTLQRDSVHLPFSADYFEAFRSIQNNSFFISKHIIGMEIKMTLRVISQCLILTSISSSAHGAGDQQTTAMPLFSDQCEESRAAQRHFTRSSLSPLDDNETTTTSMSQQMLPSSSTTLFSMLSTSEKLCICANCCHHLCPVFGDSCVDCNKTCLNTRTPEGDGLNKTIPDSFISKEKSATAVRLFRFMDCSSFPTSDGSQVIMASRCNNSTLQLSDQQRQLYEDNDTLVVLSNREQDKSHKFAVRADGIPAVCYSPSLDNEKYLHLFRFYSLEQLATLICLLVSIVSLLLVLLTYSLLPKLRNASGVIVMSLSASMLTLQGLGLLLQLPRGWLCLIVAWLLHWSQLATFLWNSVLAFDLTFTIRSKSVGHTSNGSRGRALRCYIMLCWLLPLLVVVCLAVMDHYGIYNVGYATGGQCYIGTCSSILWLMIVPMSATFLFNFSCYVCALSTIVHTSKMLRHAMISSPGGPNLADKRRLLVYIRITLIMGLTWAFYFAAVFVPLIELWIVNIVLNSSQGLYFLISFVLKRRVRIMLRDRFSSLRLCKSG